MKRTKTVQMAASVNFLVILIAILCSAVCDTTDRDAKCTQQPSNKICDIFLMRTSFYYDPDAKECKSFVYGGCEESKNVYKTEDDCYANCIEKLVTLHPPWNPRVMAVQHNSAAIIWYRPINYHRHEKLLKEYIANFNPGPGYATSGNNSNTEPGTDSTEVVPLPHDQGSETGTGDADKTTSKPTTPTPADSDKDSNNQTSGSGSAESSTSTNTSSSDKTNPNGTNTAPETNTQPNTQANATGNPSGSETSTKPQTNQPRNQPTDQPATTTKASADKPVTDTATTAAPAVGSTEPPVPDVEELPANSSLKLQDYVGKVKVPFHFAKMTHYVVAYKSVMSPNYTKISLPENSSYVNISGLKPDTEYHVKISAEYLTNTSMWTEIRRFRTRQDPSAARRCYCDVHGSVGGGSQCNMSLSQLPWCQCKPGYSGLFCEICAHGFYRTGSTLPCHKCPCTTEASTGSCHFVEGYQHCLKCHEEYSGILCHRCANGYYRDYSTSKAVCKKCVGSIEGYLHCLKCKEEYSGILCHRCANGYYRDYSTSKAVCKKCAGCHNISPGLICDPFSGKCLNCHYNTTGEQCDRCLPGFAGDPLNNVACHPQPSTYKPPPSGVIASIVVGTIVLLSGIVGIIVYRRIQRSPTNRPFWTIEFQEDHEGVNFSSVPDNDRDRNVEDLQFYGDHNKTKTKSQPYSRLHEDC